MNANWFSVLCFLLVCTYLNTSQAKTKISGTIKDESGNPLPGANIYIKNSYDGISSSETGGFSFITYEEGEAVLVASFVGYKSNEISLNLDGKDKFIEIILEEESAELGTVVISAGSFEASDEKKAVILRPLDIVTTGSDADIYSALETLPGTQQIGETEGLFVRGGSSYETKTIVDEMIVQNPFYSSVPDIPARGRFSAFLFKGTVFSTGGFSAQYGQALSSVLILNTQDLPEETLTSINLMAVGLGGTHIQRWENTSIAFEGGYYNLDPYFEVQKQRTDWIKAPESFEGNLSFRHKTSETGMLKAYTSYSYGDLSLNTPDSDNPSLKDFFRLKGGNFLLNSNYREVFGDDWVFFAGYSFSIDDDDINIESDFIRQKETLNTGKFKMTKNIFSNSFLTFGGEFSNVIYDDDFNEFSSRINEKYFAGFIESDIYITNDFAVRLGLRGERSGIINKNNIAPRLSFAYRLGSYDQLNFAFGKFYQTPQKDFLFQSTDFLFEESTHYILNYQYVGLKRVFRIEVYYKDYDNLVKGTVFTDPYLTITGIPAGSYGSGYAKGIDVFWKDSETFDFGYYWISYSYLDTKRDFRNFPVLASPTFSTPHTFSVVYKYWLQDITTSLGITYTFATGRPYYNPNNLEFLGDRTKDYHNLSLNFSYLTNLFNNFTIVFFSIDNIFGYDNIFSYRYSTDGTISTPVRPPALRNAFLGLFISLGQTNPY
ncbi:MAG: TonB-dependent receptor [Ignavibacteriaceae bacterium]